MYNCIYYICFPTTSPQQHKFSVPEKRPPATVSLAFTGLVLFPLAILAFLVRLRPWTNCKQNDIMILISSLFFPFPFSEKYRVCEILYSNQKCLHTFLVIPYVWTDGTKTSTTPSCSGPIPAQKLRGNSVLGVIFSHTIPKMDFCYSHRFSWEKLH